MKRERDSESLVELAKCLMLLSHHHQQQQQQQQQTKVDASNSEYECKTCKRKFSSFQALGGHRASHKRPKLVDGEEELKEEAKSLKLATKPNTHACSICGLEFSLGQALGGHMRKHRALLHDQQTDQVVANYKVPVLKRSNSTRVFCLDLNLTPLQNDFNLLFSNLPPAFT